MDTTPLTSPKLSSTPASSYFAEFAGPLPEAEISYESLPLLSNVHTSPTSTSLSLWQTLVKKAQEVEHTGIATLTITSTLLLSAAVVALFVFQHAIAWPLLALSLLSVAALGAIGAAKGFASKVEDPQVQVPQMSQAVVIV